MKLTIQELCAKNINKIVLSQPVKSAVYKKIVVNKLIGARKRYQAEQYTQTQVFHHNFDDLSDFLSLHIAEYRSMHTWGDESYAFTIKDGAIVSQTKLEQRTEVVAQAHNKQKNYIIKEGEPTPIFVKLGIFTRDYKVVNSMQDKFKQINRYIEMLDDVLKDFREGDNIYVVDYCSGKSYLSFAVYHYLTTIKKLKVTIDCIDLKSDVIASCRKLAQEYGYDGMEFICQDIKDFNPKTEIDLVISLHACDTATDYVLYSAVTNQAKRIFAAPCCQHECAKTLDYSYEPLLTSYGILNERIGALITDSVRCALLELNGYKTELLEFVDLSDSPKNLLIRAVKTHRPKAYVEIKRRDLESLLARTKAHFTAVDLLMPKKQNDE